MKHCIVEITYTAPLETIDRILVEHRTFLQKGYDANMLLCSGPMTPRTGGIIVARGESIDEIKRFFDGDPYCVQKAATYRFIEFSPVKHQSLLQEWV
jgi:uncharacterized protein YciI